MTGDTHILRRLGKDISLQELYHMRFELNMSVAEIAEKLGCSRPTVYKYLDLKKLNAPKKPDRKQEQRVWDEAHSLTRLQAEWRSYDLDVYRQQAVLHHWPSAVVLDPDGIHRMINELTYIEQVMKKWRDEHNAIR